MRKSHASASVAGKALEEQEWNLRGAKPSTHGDPCLPNRDEDTLNTEPPPLSSVTVPGVLQCSVITHCLTKLTHPNGRVPSGNCPNFTLSPGECSGAGIENSAEPQMTRATRERT